MLPTIPISIWEQIAVVIVFAFLLAGLGWIMVRLFTQAIADVNAHYAAMLVRTNEQWQKYFDARAETANDMSQRMTDRMDTIAEILDKLVRDFEQHDQMERQALDSMAEKRRRLSSGRGGK